MASPGRAPGAVARPAGGPTTGVRPRARHRRRRSARRQVAAPGTLLFVVLAALIVAGVAVIRVTLPEERGAAAGHAVGSYADSRHTDSHMVSGTAVSPQDAPAGPATARQAMVVRLPERGPVTGELRLSAAADLAAGPAAGLAAGAAETQAGAPFVLYVLDGPAHVTQWATEAPYEVSIDTTALPNGEYTLHQVVFRPGDIPVVQTGTVRVANPPAQPGPAAAARPMATLPPEETRPASPQPGQAPPAGGTEPPSPPATATPGQPPADASALVSEVITRTNAERLAAGCPALSVDANLTLAAQLHSEDMARQNYFAHDSLDGRSPFDRIAQAGYLYSEAAENIAAGQRTPADVVAGWMNSPTHRANILNCSLTQIGVGYATGGDYGSYWVQDFGAP